MSRTRRPPAARENPAGGGSLQDASADASWSGAVSATEATVASPRDAEANTATETVVANRPSAAKGRQTTKRIGSAGRAWRGGVIGVPPRSPKDWWSTHNHPAPATATRPAECPATGSTVQYGCRPHRERQPEERRSGRGAPCRPPDAPTTGAHGAQTRAACHPPPTAGSRSPPPARRRGQLLTPRVDRPGMRDQLRRRHHGFMQRHAVGSRVRMGLKDVQARHPLRAAAGRAQVVDLCAGVCRNRDHNAGTALGRVPHGVSTTREPAGSSICQRPAPGKVLRCSSAYRHATDGRQSATGQYESAE